VQTSACAASCFAHVQGPTDFVVSVLMPIARASWRWQAPSPPGLPLGLGANQGSLVLSDRVEGMGAGCPRSARWLTSMPGAWRSPSGAPRPRGGQPRPGASMPAWAQAFSSRSSSSWSADSSPRLSGRARRRWQGRAAETKWARLAVVLPMLAKGSWRPSGTVQPALVRRKTAPPERTNDARDGACYDGEAPAARDRPCKTLST
jgi:hypothetical protein